MTGDDVQIDTGDIVRHEPTGEEWTVGYIDETADRLAWVGWPPGFAKLSDCTFVERATPEERLWLLREMAKSDGHLASYAQRELAKVLA